LTLRPAEAGDVSALVAMFAEPDVHAWWGPETVESVTEHLRAHPSWAILVADELVGWLHLHEERTPQYPSVAFDIALNARGRGHGYGREALRLAIAHFVAQGHHRFTIDPAAGNERAIRAYRDVGFRPVGVLRAYERAPDGRWRDGLLMDLLADEFAGG
jgi:aminoglycoside 6'-N-acetyltransferase